MTGALILGSVFAGFMAGNIAVAGLGRWIVALGEIKRGSDETRGKVLRSFFATLLSSGPWIVVILGGCAYYLRHESWLPWVAAGFCMALVFLGYLFFAARRKRLARAADASASLSSGAAPNSTPSRRLGAKPPMVATCIFGFVIGLFMTPAFFAGQVPVLAWIVMPALGVAYAYVMNLFFWRFLHPKPWVERRKAPDER